MTVESPNHSVLGVVFDWAGTMVDFGSQAPVRGLQVVFEQRGIAIDDGEARADMGLAKPDHIRNLLALSRIREHWLTEYKRLPNEADVEVLAMDLERVIVDILPEFSIPVPGAIETIGRLRDRGIRCGSTTGYSSTMMEVVSAVAAEHGYSPDVVVTSTDVPKGRPCPWMCYLNAIRLDVSPLWRMVKVGDTCIDVEEGRNAGMWTVAVVRSSSELGLTEQEIAGMELSDLLQRTQQVRQRFYRKGADYVIDRIEDLNIVILDIEDRLRQGERPYA